MSRRPQRKHRAVDYTEDDYAAHIRFAHGIVAAAARNMGVSRTTVQAACKRFPRVREIREDAEDDLADLAESKLYEAIKDGNLTAVIYYLSTKGKDRGYGRHPKSAVRLPPKDLSAMTDDELSAYTENFDRNN